MAYSQLEQSLIETWLLLTTLNFKVVIIPPHRYQCGKIKTESPCYNCLPLEVSEQYQVYNINQSAASFFPNSRRNPGGLSNFLPSASPQPSHHMMTDVVRRIPHHCKGSLPDYFLADCSLWKDCFHTSKMGIGIVLRAGKKAVWLRALVRVRLLAPI